MTRPPLPCRLRSRHDQRSRDGLRTHTAESQMVSNAPSSQMNDVVEALDLCCHLPRRSEHPMKSTAPFMAAGCMARSTKKLPAHYRAGFATMTAKHQNDWWYL